MKLVQLSENTIVVLFEQRIDLNISKLVFILTERIEAELFEVIIDVIPSYASIHILFDLRKTSAEKLIRSIRKLSQQITTIHHSVKETASGNEPIEIPVYYGDEVGFDLGVIALTAGMKKKEVIKIHSERIYHVYAMGFAPGFAYLGKVDERIATPRKETPRLSIPAGSLGIANQQTAIYPSDSPGGWQIIARTPIKLVDYQQQQPTTVKTGDKVRFVPIGRQEYLQLGGQL